MHRLVSLQKHFCSSTEVRLSPAELQQFKDDGFIVVHNVFPKEDLEAIKAAVRSWVDDIELDLLNSGLLQSSYADLELHARMAAIEKEAPGVAMQLQGSWMRDRVRVMKHPAMRRIRANPNLLNVLAQLLDTPEVGGHPNCTIRIRTPTPSNASQNADRGRVPWHQDQGYLLDDAKDTLVIGAWVPLSDVSAEKGNGPMRFVRGGHRGRTVLPHMSGTAYLLLEPEAFEKQWGGMEQVTADVPFGSCVLFTSFTPHASLPNTSALTRWSFDLRYQNAFLPHGMGKNGGLVQLCSQAKGFIRTWEEGSKGPTQGVLGGYGREATESALQANEDTELRSWETVDLSGIPSRAPGNSPSFVRSMENA